MVSVGFDIDNVITQTYDFALKLVNGRLHTNYTLDDCFYHTVEECFGLPPDVVMEWFKSSDSGFPQSLLPVEGAKDVINRYSTAVDEYFISARSLRLMGDSLEWFDRQGIKYVPERVLLGNSRPEKKAKLAKDLGLELFVEDDLSNANAIAEETGACICLFMYKFNEHAVKNRGTCMHRLVIPVYEPFWVAVSREIDSRLQPFK